MFETVFVSENFSKSFLNFQGRNFFEFIENEKEYIDIESIKRKDFSNYTKHLAKLELAPSSITRKIASIKGKHDLVPNKNA